MVEKKFRKTLALPLWATKRLDEEGDFLGGKPGLVATAGLLMFFKSDSETKAKFVREVQELEVAEAYGLKDNKASEMFDAAEGKKGEK